jgi:hypothetical protein
MTILFFLLGTKWLSAKIYGLISARPVPVPACCFYAAIWGASQKTRQILPGLAGDFCPALVIFGCSTIYRHMEKPHLVRTYARLSALDYWLERSIEIPGLGRKIGLDGVLGLIPGFGDALAGTLGAYILFEGWRAGMPKRQLLGMALRLGMDTGVGMIPIAGDLWDFFYAANSRNLKTVKTHLESLGVMLPLDANTIIDGGVLSRF